MSFFDSTSDTYTELSAVDMISDEERNPISVATAVVWTNIVLSALGCFILIIKMADDKPGFWFWILIFAILLQSILSWALFKMFASITANIVLMRKGVENLNRVTSESLNTDKSRA